MPLVEQITAMSISRHHLTFDIRNRKKSADTTIQNTIISEPDLYLKGQIHLIRCRRPVVMVRHGTTTFRDYGTAIPLTPPLTPTQMAWNSIASYERNGNVDFNISASKKEIFCSCDGDIDIDVEWTVNLDSPASYKTTAVYLYLYKNNILVDKLDAKPMFITLAIAGDYYFPFMSLQGSYKLNVTKNDYIDIRYSYANLPAGTSWTLPTAVSGYINLNYSSNKIQGI